MISVKKSLPGLGTNLKIFWGSMPPDPPRHWCLRHASGLPPCTQISTYSHARVSAYRGFNWIIWWKTWEAVHSPGKGVKFAKSSSDLSTLCLCQNSIPRAFCKPRRCTILVNAYMYVHAADGNGLRNRALLQSVDSKQIRTIKYN